MTRWIDAELSDRKHLGLYRVRRLLESSQGVRVRFRGREYLNFASNDYLNLGGDPRLARAAARAARRFGCGAGASPLVAGYLPPLHALERRLAQWESAPATLVFSSGFAANLATVSALAGPADAIFSDQLNHASLIDGCRLSRAKVHVYRHADSNHLEELLYRHGSGARRRLIVSDTVFSMDGDLAPLAELYDLAERHDALLVIDEAHATGVMGADGRGVTDLVATAINFDRVIKIGTLSKALGAQGGFVCGSRQAIAWLVNDARAYIYSTALAPPSAAAARRAVTIVRNEPAPRQQLQALASFLRQQLGDIGYPSNCSKSQIVPILIGDARSAAAVAAQLRQHGLLVPAIRPPTVPDGTARLRVCLTAGHTEADVMRLIEAFRSVKVSPEA